MSQKRAVHAVSMAVPDDDLHGFSALAFVVLKDLWDDEEDAVRDEEA